LDISFIFNERTADIFYIRLYYFNIVLNSDNPGGILLS